MHRHRSHRATVTLAGLLSLIVTHSIAAASELPIPISGAAHFVSAIPGLVANDVCQIQDADATPDTGLSFCDFGLGQGQEFGNGTTEFIDARGWHYTDKVEVATGVICVKGNSSWELRQYALHRVSAAGSTESLGTFQDSCETEFIRGVSVQPLGIDMANGLYYLNVHVTHAANSTGISRRFLVEVKGLPSLLDIILSYQPPSTLSFNVPVRPEGLPGADSFSVYSGNVRTASDLSQATPLQCTVPAGRPPVPGEHLTVLDPLPDPAMGDARYYVASVNHQSDRRAGRTSINGVMQGRNAGALAGCP